MELSGNITGRRRGIIAKACFLFSMLVSLFSVAAESNGYSVKFTFTATDSKGEEVYNEQGVLSVYGSAFRLEIEDELLMIANGAEQWIYRAQTDDIIVANNSIEAPSSQLVNKSEMVERFVSLFAMQDGSSLKSSIVKDGNGRVKEILLSLDGGSYYKIKIDSIDENKEFSQDYFLFNASHYPNAIITDLR